MTLSLNQRAHDFADLIAADADALRVAARTLDGGTRVIDCGSDVPGGLEAGRRFAEIASAGVPLFLVDGFAAGTWWLRRRTLLAVPFRPLPSAAEQAVEEEARRLLPFVFPGEEEATVAFAEEGSLPLNRLQIMMGRD